jgi:hypothetical protein
MAHKPFRQNRPQLEGLESRQLLNGSRHDRTLLLPNGQPISDAMLTRLVDRLNAAGVDPQALTYGQASSAVLGSLPERRKAFRLNDGTRVSLTLYGVGTLKGTYQDADGALNIRYDDTNESSRIIAKTVKPRGGEINVPLRSLRDIDVPAESESGVGSNLIDSVNLANFDLVRGGYINLSGGVRILSLDTIEAETQVNVRSLPIPENTTTAVDGIIAPAVTIVTAPGGGTELTGVGGLLVPGSLTVDTTATETSPPGVTILARRILGEATGDLLDPAQMFGYDPTTQQLIRFDSATGNVVGTPIAVPGAPPASGQAGVGLARVDGNLYVLVGVDTRVYAYDAVTGAPAPFGSGSFSTAGFNTNGAAGPEQITGIARSDTRTVLVSAVNQKAQSIDVLASLTTGQAVGIGTPYTPANEFTLTGEATGAAGLATIGMTGQGYFNVNTPNTQSPAFLLANTRGDTLSEAGRQSSSAAANAGGFGSLGIYPALVTGVQAATATTPARNVVTLFNATSTSGTLSADGTIYLNWANKLTGLSESVHPELVGQSIINVSGILTRIHAKQAQGMVLNGIGYLNTIDIEDIRDSSIIGLPVGHVVFARRSNVEIVSSSNRPTGTANGVTIIDNLRTPGPLAPPRQRRV